MSEGIPVYSYEGRYVEFRGVKIAPELFVYFTDDANVGRLFRFVDRKDGVITAECVPPGDAG